MTIKKIIQEVFDKSIIELSSTGMIKQTNYGIIANTILVPLECDDLKRTIDPTSLQSMVSVELAKINASGWITVGVGAMVIKDKIDEKPPKRKAKSTTTKKPSTKTKSKKKQEEQILETLLGDKPPLSLIAIHRTKTGETNILYSKLLQDPKGTFYTDLEEKWIDRKEGLQITEQN